MNIAIINVKLHRPYGRYQKQFVCTADSVPKRRNNHRKHLASNSGSSISGKVYRCTGFAQPGSVKGLKTYVKNAEIDAQNNVSGYTETVWLYDNKERPLWEIPKYSDGSLLKINLFYDFSGNLLKENICVTLGAKRDELEYVNSYDSRERLQTRTVSLNEGSASSAKATIQYGYDDIGRSSGKSCHVNGGVTMSISDAYTMQQRLRVHETSISGQVLYSENLKYDDSPAYADIVPLYGGLIAEIQQNIEDIRQYILVFQNSLLPLSIN